MSYPPPGQYPPPTGSPAGYRPQHYQPQAVPRVQYSTQVNKGSINMGHLERMLNDRALQGWRLAHVLEQAGNTVMIFERPV